jgi:hypothetical protein
MIVLIIELRIRITIMLTIRVVTLLGFTPRPPRPLIVRGVTVKPKPAKLTQATLANRVLVLKNIVKKILIIVKRIVTSFPNPARNLSDEGRKRPNSKPENKNCYQNEWR